MQELFNFWELQDQIAHVALKCTCQNFVFENKKIKANGCGVFIKVDNNYFMCTAAHVIEDKVSEIFVKTRNHGLITLGGNVNLNTTSGDRSLDKVDILLIRLNIETINLLADTYDYLDKSELGINHELQVSPSYISVGFPASRSRLSNSNNTLTTIPYSFCSKIADQSIYSRLKYDKNQNIIVQYNKKRNYDYLTGKPETGPDLYGISGSGLWFIPYQEKPNNEKIKKKLVAIMTDWSPINRHYIVGTRIDFFTELIRKKYSLDLEKSKLVRIEIFE